MSDDSHSNLHYVAPVDEVAEANRVITEISGRQIAVFNVEGEYHALLNFCPHQGGPVCEGVVAGNFGVDEAGQLVYENDLGTVACPWHGWQFEIDTGRHVAKSNYKIPTYDVVVEDGDIYIET